MAINFNALATNPMLNLGLGILGGNVGATPMAAFANAMQGGLLGLGRASQQQQQLAATQLAQQQFEAEQAQQALEEQRMQERQQAGLGLLGQAGVTPEQQAYYSTFKDPYGEYQKSLPEPGEDYTLGPGGMRFNAAGQRIAFNPTQKSPLVQVGGGMKPSERVNAAIKLADQGYVDNLEQGLAVVDQQTGAQPTSVTQDVQQGVSQQAAGAPTRTMSQQQRKTRENLLKADADGVTGMQRADRSYQQAQDVIGQAQRALQLLPEVKTGVLWGSEFGQAAQSALSEEASEFFNILNNLATMEKVDMIGATGAKAFDSEKEAMQLMKGLIGGRLQPGVLRKKLNSVVNKFNRNIKAYDNLKKFSTDAGIDWSGSQEQQQQGDQNVTDWADM